MSLPFQNFNEKNLIRMLIIVTVIVNVFSIVLTVSRTGDFGVWFVNWTQSLGTELVSAVFISFVVMGYISEQVNLKNRLIGNLRHESKGEIIRAIKRLREKGWLFDGSLQGIRLVALDYEVIDMSDADLRNVDLNATSMTHANLSRACLTGSQMQVMNLSHCNLSYANLQKVELWFSNLENADLRGADLRGANLREANLRGAKLNKETKIDSTTKLPDGLFATQDTHYILRFTNSGHQNFWRSEDEHSPAYKFRT